MKLEVSKSQSTESTGMISKKTSYVYTLTVKAIISEDEASLLSKYNLMDKSSIVDPEISARFSVANNHQGPEYVSLAELVNGVSWSTKGELSIYLAGIPGSIRKNCETLLGTAHVRENWGGNETIDIIE